MSVYLHVHEYFSRWRYICTKGRKIYSRKIQHVSDCFLYLFLFLHTPLSPFYPFSPLERFLSYLLHFLLFKLSFFSCVVNSKEAGYEMEEVLVKLYKEPIEKTEKMKEFRFWNSSMLSLLKKSSLAFRQDMPDFNFIFWHILSST